MAITNVESMNETNLKNGELPTLLNNVIAEVKKEPETRENSLFITKLQEAVMWWFQGHGGLPTAT